MTESSETSGHSERRRHLAAVAGVCLVAGIALWLGPGSDPSGEKHRDVAESGTASDFPFSSRDNRAAMPPPAEAPDKPAPDIEFDASDLEHAVAGQILITFADEDALRRFLAAAGEPIDAIARLRTARLSLDQFRRLSNLIEENSRISLNYYVSPPTPPEPGTVQEGAAGFGSDLVNWLGAEGDRSQWGAGITIAVIDTGIENHPNLPSGIRMIDLADGGEINGHGTAVASVIAGTSPFAPGLAPAARLLSIRIAGADGASDSFSLAQGILQAVDSGARLINISMGSYGDSNLVRDAVSYAQSRGALIIAASGNEGVGSPVFPAALPGVLAVGAVDARGTRMEFSNFGSHVGSAAPGFEVNAAWPGEQWIAFSGTSASTGVATGAIAAIMTMHGGAPLSPQAALNLYQSYSNEAGPPGPDPFYGYGIPDLWRVQNRNNPDIFDGAVASQVLTVNPGDGLPRLVVTVQNQGTRPLINSTLNLSTPGNPIQRNIASLAPGAIRSYEFRVPISWVTADGALTTTAGLTLDPAQRDLRPVNNSLTTTLPVKP